MAKSKKSATRKKSSVKVRDLGAKNDPAGGTGSKHFYEYGTIKSASSTDGTLDAGVHFKYDVKTEKES